MIDLVSISFVKSLELFSCMKKKHQHTESNLEKVSETSSKIYDIYYLRLYIIDWWNHSLDFIRSFVTIDHSIQNSQILLERSVLKDFKINICNSIDSWKFEWKLKIIKISSSDFAKKLSFTACVFSIWTAYWSCLNNNDDEHINFWDDESNTSDNLSNMFKYLCQKYQDFFNTHNADWLASHQAADHVIELKFDTKSSYICMYNMFSAELKTLDNYLNNVLVKKWIHKSQNFADASILFVLQKSDKLCLCINYYELNAIIIKNYYLLLLTSELLD